MLRHSIITVTNTAKKFLLANATKLILVIAVVSLISISIFPSYAGRLSGRAEENKSFSDIGFNYNTKQNNNSGVLGVTTYAGNIVPTTSFFDSDLDYADSRTVALQSYLEKRGSPTAEYADLYIKYADLYNVPWILMPAIGEAETHGCTYKAEYNISSPSEKQKNCWGIGGGPATRFVFDTWDEAIEYAVRLISEHYGQHRISMTVIQRKYCGTECVEDVWARRVMYYVDLINEHVAKYGVEPDVNVTL